MKFTLFLLLTLISSTAIADYDRESFAHWLDEDSDCIDTRHEILIRDSKADVKMGYNGCYVSKGVWVSPYDGKRYYRARDLHVDHLVPLAHAYYNGARDWSLEKKAEFANDPLNLLAVDASSNMSKSASGPSVWRPDNQGYWCEYAKRWTQVKLKYELTSTSNEKQALREMISYCRVTAN